MRDAIVVLNAGSSSIKFSVFGAQDESLELLVRGQVESIYTTPRFVARDAAGMFVDIQDWSQDGPMEHSSALTRLLGFLESSTGGYRTIAVGHRVVHGGLEFRHPALVDATALRRLERLIPLAPLHQPHNLAAIGHLLRVEPDLPQVACFDTAFHADQPELAQLYSLPWELAGGELRRYGFHGLSYEYIASVLPEHDTRAAEGNTIVLHLGNGASMCAMLACRSVATTMGFSSADGLPMGTRSGALDPGVILFLIEQRGMTAKQVEKLIYERSGLLGLSGISSDMRVLGKSEDPRAKLAVDYFVYRIGRELGSLTAALGGLDGIVFTAGIGENAAGLRQRVCDDAAWLGVQLDADANGRGGPCISAAGSDVSVWVLSANEELMIARHTLRAIVKG